MRTSAAEANRAVYERYPEVYDSRELQKPEQLLLKRFKGRWADMTMLDIGVGSGRTSYTFAPITKSYVGIDFSSAMVELSRERVGEDESTRFLVCDARELADRLGERFDLVLFSYNGLDAVGDADRRTILDQVRRSLKDDGHFLFSSHSLKALPLRAGFPKVQWLRPLRSTYRLTKAARLAFRMKRANNGALTSEEGEWAQLSDQSHNGRGSWYYVLPEYQVTQLAEAGFSVEGVYDLAGSAVDPQSPGRDPWLYYLCTPGT